MMKLFKLATGLALAVALTACGGGGGNPGTQVPGSNTTSSGSTTTTTTTATPVANTTTSVVTPASIEVLAGANEVLSAGAQVLITAVVKNLNNVGMADQPVVFSADSGTLLAETITNEDGVATARLSSGASKALRNINVTVRSGTATGSISLPVTGTRLTLTGATSLKFGDVQTYTARLLDSSGNPISGAPISVASSLGNGLSSSTLMTDFNGGVQFIYTANIPNTDTLTVSGLGASAGLSIVTSNIDLIVVSPGAGTNVTVGNPQIVTVQYRAGNVPVVGANVQFSTTRGSLNVSNVVTDAAGRASVTLTSSASGPALVVAQITGVGQVSLPLSIVATTPANLVLQANPGAVLPNAGGGSSNQSTLEAVVTDVGGNAIPNRQVNFSIFSDSGNGGQLSSPTANTDISGRAQVQFVPGPQSTPANGVRLQAEVLGAPTTVLGTAALTVNGQALFISIAFGNVISSVDETTYSKPFAIYITDANGNAVGNQSVTISAVPRTYSKGYFLYGGVNWVKVADLACENEDSNRNGSLDGGEDFNRDGFLTPGNKAVPTPGTVRTDAQGRATFSLQYGEQYAYWVVVDLIARANVQGTESSTLLRYELEGLSSDYSNETIAPAGQTSPFGGGRINGVPIPLSCSSPI